jgi:calcium release-activated calcium channel protein 1
VPFGLCMSLVALLEICSMLICALLLTAVVRVGKDFVCEEEEAEFMARCHAFVTRYQWVALSERQPFVLSGGAASKTW